MDNKSNFPFDTYGSDTYPDEFVSSKVKKKDQWGLQYMRAAWSEQEKSESFSLDSRVARYVSTRKLAEGLASLESVKNLFDQDVDLTFLNVNEFVSTPLPKILIIATRTIYNQPYKPMAIPVDSASISKSNNKRNQVLAKMALEKERVRMEGMGVTGVIDPPTERLPVDEEELEIHMQMNPKIAEAIAMEYFIRQGYMQNNVEDIEEKVAKDLVDLKIGITRVYFDKDLNLKVKYVDPVNFISSWVNQDDFDDARHMGEAMKIPISQLREMMAGKYNEADLAWIAKNMTFNNRTGWKFGDMKYYDNNYQDSQDYDSNLVQVIHLEVRQYDRRTYVKKEKSNGGFRLDKKSPTYEAPVDGVKRELIHTGAQAFYEGYWIVGSDYIWDWGRKDDAWRDRLNKKWSSTAKFTYTAVAPNIFDMENKSITERCRYHDELFKILELKKQQFIITADPPGNDYDIDRILGAVKGMGDDDIGPLEMINMKTQTGRFLTSSKDENGDILPQASAIRKVESGIDKSLIIIEDIQDRAIMRMKDVAGINEAVDGSTPDKKALVGTMELSIEGHKASVADLQKAFRKIFRETAKKIYQGYQYQILNNVNTKELEASLGELNLLEVDLAALSNADFDIGIEMLPTQQELRDFQERLANFAEAGLIPPEDAIGLVRIANESLLNAEMLLTHKARRFREQQSQEKQQAIQLQNEGLAQVAQAKIQMETQLEGQKGQMEMTKQQQEYDLELRNKKADWVEKSKFEMLQTENKLKLIQEASKQKKGEKKDEDVRKFTSDPSMVTPGTEKKGYDLERDSIPRVAGRVEPSLGIPSGIASPPSVETGATAQV